MIIGGIDLGNLPLYLLFYSNGSVDANWQGATKGFIGDVAVDGIQASERTSGGVPYAGTIYTNDSTLGAWQDIVDQNAGQAFASYNEIARIAGLEADLVSAFQQINLLTANPGDLPAPYNINFDGTIQSLDGLNTQNGVNEVFVLNITSGFNGISDQIDITGDAGDIFIFRWDEDANPANGYQGQVKFQSGGAIVPHGGLKTTNFINVAGDIGSSGGGSTPPPPYPQGPRYNDGLGPLIIGGQDFSGGGFFSGYWLTTGAPENFDPVTGLWYGGTSSLSNAIFAGGWYSITDQFSMTSGTSGVYVSPPLIDQPSIDLEKEVSPDNGITWFDADTPTGPTILSGTTPLFRFTVTNTGNVTLNNVTLTDDIFGTITIPTTTLAPGEFFIVTTTEPWTAGQHVNIATVTGTDGITTVTDTDPAHYFGLAVPAIDIEKYVSPDNGTTWIDADNPPGPSIPSSINPQFRFVVTNTGDVTLTNVVVNDDVFGLIGTLPSLAPGASFEWIIVAAWALGSHVDNATATGLYNGTTVADTDPAHYLGEQVDVPAIDVEKLVSPDGGITFNDADFPPGPSILEGTNPVFRYIVINTGNVTLINITLIDTVFGPIVTPTTTLAPGEFFEVTTTQPWVAGQHTNVATVTGTDGVTTVTDSDPANYFGLANVITIDLEKEVSPDNGVTWFDADTPTGPIIPSGITPVFRFIVTNTGNVTLSNITLTDDIFGPIVIPTTTLAPGELFEVTTTEPWTAGQHTNNATVTGQYNGTTVTDTDPANYFGLAAPAIEVVKYVSVDNGVTWFDANTPPYPDLVFPINPRYRFVVTNIGDVELTQVTLTDTDFGVISLGGTLAPGGTFTTEITGTFASGQHCNTATVTGAYVTEVGVIAVEDTDPACFVGVGGPAINIEKFVSIDNGATWLSADTAPGPLLPDGVTPQFRFVVTNTGTVPLTNIQVTDTVFGLIGTLPLLNPGGTFEWIKIG